MRKRSLLCVLLGAIAWGQAAPGTPPPAQSAPAQPAVVGGKLPTPVKPPAPAAQAGTSAAVPDDAAVITVKGVCAPQPKATPAKGATAKPATKAPAADCKTVITKSKFDLLLKALPNTSNPQAKRNIAARWSQAIPWSHEAVKKGLDKKPEFAVAMQFAKAQILAVELQQKVQEDAAKVSDAAIADYYKKNPEAYEQYTLERLVVPRSKQVEASAKEEKEEQEKKGEKPTEEELKAKQAEEKAKQEENEMAMSKLAESLRTRAAAGEDFATLQKEAFDAAGMKIQPPTVSMPNVRRTGLSPAHASVFELKPGEVSQVINDAGGHYIYKLKSEEELPLDDKVKDEIHRTLQSQRAREAMDKINNSFTVEKNEAYLGPETPGPGMPFRPAPGGPRVPANAPGGQPPVPAQPAAPPSAAPAPAQPPAPKPN